MRFLVLLGSTAGILAVPGSSRDVLTAYGVDACGWLRCYPIYVPRARFSSRCDDYRLDGGVGTVCLQTRRFTVTVPIGHRIPETERLPLWLRGLAVNLSGSSLSG